VKPAAPAYPEEDFVKEDVEVYAPSPGELRPPGIRDMLYNLTRKPKRFGRTLSFAPVQGERLERGFIESRSSLIGNI
jgi:hypothetical protein